MTPISRWRLVADVPGDIVISSREVESGSQPSYRAASRRARGLLPPIQIGSHAARAGRPRARE